MSACPICAAELPAPRIRSPDRGQGTPGEFVVAECSECGAGVTLPLVAPNQLGAFYPATYAPHSGVEHGLAGRVSRLVRALQGRSEWRSEPLASIAARAPGSGLDVGAGRGDLAVLLQSHGWRMTAIEPSPGAVAGMRERGLDARGGMLGTVELEPGAYDIAIFKHSLEHTPEPVEDLRRTYTALRPGGEVVVSVPNFASWQRRRFADAWFHLDVPRHRVHFTADALARALSTAGFEPARFTRSSSAVGLAASIQYRLAGRCLFRGGLKLRIAAGLCALTLPLTRALDRFAGEPDTLHAVARKAPAA